MSEVGWCRRCGARSDTAVCALCAGIRFQRDEIHGDLVRFIEALGAPAPTGTALESEAARALIVFALDRRATHLRFDLGTEFPVRLTIDRLVCRVSEIGADLVPAVEQVAKLVSFAALNPEQMAPLLVFRQQQLITVRLVPVLGDSPEQVFRLDVG